MLPRIVTCVPAVSSDMADKEWCPSNLLDVFGDPIARATLVIANQEPVAVKEVADRLGVSDPTIYRRIDPLVEANLLKVHHRIDQDGNQHKAYETLLDEATFKIEGRGYEVDIQVKQDIADDFESMWTDLKSTDAAADAAGTPQPPTGNSQGDPT